MTSWSNKLEQAQKTALLQDGRRKVHYTFDDGEEMVEEYDVMTNELLLRKLRGKSTLGGQKAWEIEVGEQVNHVDPMKEAHFVESISMPTIVRRDKLDCFQWRIRNLPYPIDTYNLSVEDKLIIVRTTNKKYFKKIAIPDLDRLNLDLNESALTYAHSNNTLIISYKKPTVVKEFEKRLISSLKKLKEEGDVNQCKQQ